MNKHHFATRLFCWTLALYSSHTLGKDSITVGLRWQHQFQFAGYYAAIDQGFYAQENLEVTLIEGDPDKNTIEQVVSQQIDFGIANGDLIIERLRGQPVVALSAIFSFSPSVLLTLKSSGINKPSDLAGKTIMTKGGALYPSFIAMLKANHLDRRQVEFVNSSLNLQDLIDGKVDAFGAYLSNEPHQLDKLGIDYHILAPHDYGIEDYCDFLFTSQSLIVQKPKVVQAFHKATLKGWHYALANPDQVIHSIIEKWGAKKTVEELRYEASVVSNLVRSNLVEIGYINPDRVNEMADILLEDGLLTSKNNLEDFIYRAEQQAITTANNRVILLTLVLVSLLALCIILMSVMRKLKREIKSREEVEAKLRHLASIDPLTQLYNRRMFSQLLSIEEKKAKRTKTPYSLVLLDIDLFKAINDQYGHNTGDRVIQGVAKTITEIARSCDICARFGGEEFVVLLSDTNLTNAITFSQRFRTAINQQVFVADNQQTFSITSSFGVVEWDFKDPVTQVIAHADDALYQAKRAGRDCIRAHKHPLSLSHEKANKVEAQRMI